MAHEPPRPPDEPNPRERMAAESERTWASPRAAGEGKLEDAGTEARSEARRSPQLVILQGEKGLGSSPQSLDPGTAEDLTDERSVRPALQLLTRENLLTFEEEVLEVLKETSPEHSPASPAARRMGRLILIWVAVIESILMLGFGWYLKGWEGALFGLLGLLAFGLARAFLIILAGIARARDWSRAEDIVRQRRKERQQRRQRAS